MNDVTLFNVLDLFASVYGVLLVPQVAVLPSFDRTLNKLHRRVLGAMAFCACVVLVWAIHKLYTVYFIGFEALVTAMLMYFRRVYRKSPRLHLGPVIE